MNSPPAGLKVEKVHVWRGDRHVLQGVSVEVAANELVHISGPNGTGKTTLLRVISGLLRPEQGSVTWLGQSIASHPSEYHAALAYAAHEPALKGDLTALELAAEKAGWDTPPPDGRARGITCSSFLSHCAQVTEIADCPSSCTFA